MLERIAKITERWFISEEALFAVFCTHQLAEHRDMECPVRVGKGVIEVNPDLCADISDRELEERLRVEVIRILLKHPYDRQPEGCCQTARALGSNCVISDSYYFRQVQMEQPSHFGLPSNQHFEFYARSIQKMLQPSSGKDNSDDNPNPTSNSNQQGESSSDSQQGESSSDSQQEESSNDSQQGDSSNDSQQGESSSDSQQEESSNDSQQGDDSNDSQQGDSSNDSQQGDSSNDSQQGGGSNGSQQGGGSNGSQGKEWGDTAANWQQDELMAAQINEVIRDIQSWGSLPGQLVEEIIASTRARVDYRKILAGFRATILSQKRKLTRMRPNRRSGFEAMGSRYDFTTRMIIGVDCSGSITTNDLRHFYSTINRFFQYGIQQIDVVTFDTQLGEVQTLRKASPRIKVVGRGGTCFQPFIDYVAQHPQYDGALIYTDGYAPPPDIPSHMHTPLCWVLHTENDLHKHEHWMRRSGKVCAIEG